MYARIKQTVDSLQGRRAGISPSVDAFTRTYGNDPITEFTISRTVLNPLLTGAIGAVSPSFRRKTDGTKLYHLQVLVRTSKTSFNIEKTERITIGRYNNRQGSENLRVSVPPGLTLNMMLERTHLLMGGKFLSYSARDNNCSNFVLAMLLGNNLSTPSNILFTEQATQHLFTPELRKASNTITDLAGAANIIVQGGEIAERKTTNAWISHIKVYAHQNDLKFSDALKSPGCKSSYQKKSSRQ